MSDSERDSPRERERLDDAGAPQDAPPAEAPRQEFKAFVGGISWELDDKKLKDRKDMLVVHQSGHSYFLQAIPPSLFQI